MSPSRPAALPSPHLLRLALGCVFFHFGFLKFFPDLSPAEMLASQTIVRLTGGGMDAQSAIWWLALLECTIGIAFLLNVCLRLVSVLFLIHMIGTFMPLFVLPELAFKIGPLAPTLEGQYILKNIVFLAAGWTVLLPHCLPQTKSAPGAANRVPMLSVVARRQQNEHAFTHSKRKSESWTSAASRVAHRS